jgi:predicted PurR-regulated permease PerM
LTPTPQPAVPADWPRAARYAAVVALAALLIAAALFVQPVLSVIVVGALIAAVTGWLARQLSARTALRPVPAVLIVYALLVLVLVLLALTALPWIVRALEALLAALRAGSAGDPIGERLELIFTTAQLERLAATVAGWVTGLLAFILGSIARLFYVLALGLFLSLLIHLDLGGRGLRLLDRLPPAHARELRLLGRDLLPLWTRFVGASLIFAGLVGVGSLIEFVILGVPYPVLMAVLTGLITPIPSIGGLLSSIIVAVPALLFGSTRFTEMSPLTFAALVWALNAVITQVAYNFVLMPVLGKAVRLPVSVVLIGVLASFAVNNILFAFLVVPVLASLRIIAEYLYAKIQRREPFPEDGAPVMTGRGRESAQESGLA